MSADGESEAWGGTERGSWKELKKKGRTLVELKGTEINSQEGKDLQKMTVEEKANENELGTVITELQKKRHENPDRPQSQGAHLLDRVRFAVMQDAMFFAATD